MENNKNGFNPMNWVCISQGCFNKKKRPKIEVFADCFPGAISFSDIDAIVERRGHFLLMEWKGDGVLFNANGGQSRMFNAMTIHENFTVFVVSGDAETMTISGWFEIVGAVQGDFIYGNIDDLIARVSQWSDAVDRMPLMLREHAAKIPPQHSFYHRFQK